MGTRVYVWRTSGVLCSNPFYLLRQWLAEAAPGHVAHGPFPLPSRGPGSTGEAGGAGSAERPWPLLGLPSGCARPRCSCPPFGPLLPLLQDHFTQERSDDASGPALAPPRLPAWGFLDVGVRHGALAHRPFLPEGQLSGTFPKALLKAPHSDQQGTGPQDCSPDEASLPAYLSLCSLGASCVLRGWAAGDGLCFWGWVGTWLCGSVRNAMGGPSGSTRSTLG